ncbi:MAG: hypothetical protein SVW77_02850 [Candidatus Nanohaloarchaea archaeon]|nr:hypothetical protein [Candidatus Nanohaloarchaea archaeon]
MDLEERWTAVQERFGAVLTEPETAFDTVKKLTGLGIGMSVASVSFALATTFVQRGNATMMFVSLALFWSGYLFAHYTATGKIIHQGGSGRKIPESRVRAVLAVAGILLLLASITAIPLPAVQGDAVHTALAGLTAGLGYVMAHYGFTGDPL